MAIAATAGLSVRAWCVCVVVPWAPAPSAVESRATGGCGCDVTGVAAAAVAADASSIGLGTLGTLGGTTPPATPLAAAAVGVELTGRDAVDAGTLAAGAGLGRLLGVTGGGAPVDVMSIPRAVATAAPPAAAPVGVVSMSEPDIGTAEAGVGTPIPVGPSNLVVKLVTPFSIIFSPAPPTATPICAGAGLGVGAAGGGVGAGTGLPTPLPLLSRLGIRLGPSSKLDAAVAAVVAVVAEAGVDKCWAEGSGCLLVDREEREREVTVAQAEAVVELDRPNITELASEPLSSSPSLSQIYPFPELHRLLASLSRSRELSASLGGTEEPVRRSDARPLSSLVAASCESVVRL